MDGKDFQNVIDRSWQLRSGKRFREAELLLLEALADIRADSRERNRLLANLADVLLQQGNRSEARKLALEVLQKEPSQALALTVLGLVALERKEAVEAVENLSKAYSGAPNQYRAGRLARALEMDGREAEALVLLQEALQKYPGDSYLIKQYGHLKEKNPAPPAANEHQPAEHSRSEENTLAYAEQIKARLQQLKPAEAACQLQKIIKIGKRKENPHLFMLLGDYWRRAGEEAQAAQAYGLARELDPDNILALSQLLYSYRRLGNKVSAWPLLKLLLYHRPGDQTAKAALLKDAVELEKSEEAAIFLGELISRYPHRKELYGLIRKLKQADDLRQEKIR